MSGPVQRSVFNNDDHSSSFFLSKCQATRIVHGQPKRVQHLTGERRGTFHLGTSLSSAVFTQTHGHSLSWRLQFLHSLKLPLYFYVILIKGHMRECLAWDAITSARTSSGSYTPVPTILPVSNTCVESQ